MQHESSDWAEYRDALARHLDAMHEKALGQGAIAYGFKLMWNQIPIHLRPLTCQWLRERQVGVICLERGVKLLQYASMVASSRCAKDNTQQEHCYHRHEARLNQSSVFEPIELDVSRLLRFMTTSRADDMDMLCWAQSTAPYNHHHVLYEDFVENTVSQKKLLTILGLPNEMKESAVQYYPLNEGTCAQRIKSYPLVLDRIQGTPSACYCERIEATHLG